MNSPLKPYAENGFDNDSQPTVGFSGSGGAGNTPLPKIYSAGLRRIPSAAKPLSAANGVGRVHTIDA